MEHQIRIPVIGSLVPVNEHQPVAPIVVHQAGRRIHRKACTGHNQQIRFLNGPDALFQNLPGQAFLIQHHIRLHNAPAGTSGYTMQVAKQFANKLGYNVEPVWVSKQNGGPTYVNLAPVVSGVIIYSDLVKVAVDDNGVCGFEGLGYLANHKNRVFDKMARNDNIARQKLAQGMKITNSNMALVPKGEKEILCFEFECVMDDEQYFVYIDANTLDEVDIFKVIKGTEGYTVM